MSEKTKRHCFVSTHDMLKTGVILGPVEAWWAGLCARPSAGCH